MTERQLIEGCQRKDRRCEYEIFRQYGGKLLTVCRRYAKTEAEAEDWLQDAFIRIFSKINQYRFEGSFEGWLRRVTIHVILKKFQKKTFQNSPVDPDFLPETTIDPVALSQLQAEDLMNMISDLPDGYRVVFNLFAIEGYSHKEIADMLDIVESTSRSQLTKARRLLQEAVVGLKSWVL